LELDLDLKNLNPFISAAYTRNVTERTCICNQVCAQLTVNFVLQKTAWGIYASLISCDAHLLKLVQHR